MVDDTNYKGSTKYNDGIYDVSSDKITHSKSPLHKFKNSVSEMFEDVKGVSKLANKALPWVDAGFAVYDGINTFNNSLNQGDGVVLSGLKGYVEGSNTFTMGAVDAMSKQKHKDSIQCQHY